MSWLNKLLQTFFNFREKSDGDVVKPFLDHMEDLRWTLLKMLFALVGGMAVAFYFVTDLMRLLKQPLGVISPELENQLITTGIVDSFVITLELAFFAGIVLSLPFLIYFLASFVLPALTRHEKKFLFPGILISTLLFMAGVLTSYYWLLPRTLQFFYNYAQKIGVKTLWSWRDYLSFCSWLTIGFGLLCQLPIVILALALLGLVDYRLLSRTRAYAITGILILSAIIAPTPDPMTFITLGAPIIVLYEACIWIVWLIDRRKARAARLRDV